MVRGRVGVQVGSVWSGAEGRLDAEEGGGGRGRVFPSLLILLLLLFFSSHTTRRCNTISKPLDRITVEHPIA